MPLGPTAPTAPRQAILTLRPMPVCPKSRAKKQRKSVEEIAAAHGLTPAEVGSIDGERFLGFVWRMAGRPQISLSDWKRERPLYIVLDTTRCIPANPYKMRSRHWKQRMCFSSICLPTVPSCPRLSLSGKRSSIMRCRFAVIRRSRI